MFQNRILRLTKGLTSENQTLIRENEKLKLENEQLKHNAPSKPQGGPTASPPEMIPPPLLPDLQSEKDFLASCLVIDKGKWKGRISNRKEG